VHFIKIRVISQQKDTPSGYFFVGYIIGKDLNLMEGQSLRQVLSGAPHNNPNFDKKLGLLIV